MGTKITQIVSKYGNSSKTVSVYGIMDVAHPIKSSSGGINLNIGNFTLNMSIGLDDLGISGSLVNGNTSSCFGIKANLSELKVGFEYSSAVEWDNTTETTYTNISFNGWFLAAAAIFGTTGQSIPTPSYSYGY